MAVQLSVNVRNARLDVIESYIGVSAIMRIFTGPKPAICALPDAGLLLAELVLPVNWMAPAAGGQKAMMGFWNDLSANNSGIAGHFRIYEQLGVICHLQGTCSAIGGGGDLQFDTVNFMVGQTVTILSFNLTSGNP